MGPCPHASVMVGLVRNLRRPPSRPSDPLRRQHEMAGDPPDSRCQRDAHAKARAACPGCHHVAASQLGAFGWARPSSMVKARAVGLGAWAPAPFPAGRRARGPSVGLGVEPGQGGGAGPGLCKLPRRRAGPRPPRHRASASEVRLSKKPPRPAALSLALTASSISGCQWAHDRASTKYRSTEALS